MDGQIVVLVTGCAKGGIGHEYCMAFAERNCRVFASDIPSRFNEMSELVSETIEAIELDVTSDDSVASAVDTIIKKCGQIDVVVNNAGIGSSGPLAELGLDSIRRAWEVNTLGQLRVVQRVVPHMASRHSGCIVNIGSIVGLAPTPWAGSYCASKAAVHAMSHALRVELRPFGVHVTLVMPGAVRSNFGNANVARLGPADWKLYRDFTDSIAERATASQGPRATDARLLARHVAAKVLSRTPPKQIIFGRMSGLFKVLTWSPLWVRDLFFTTRFNIKKKL